MGGVFRGGNRRGRGVQLATALAGSWRASPGPLPTAGALVELLPLALHSGAAGLVWQRARISGTEAVRAAQSLQDAFRLNTLRAGVQEGNIKRAVELLRSAGVEPVLGKGWLAAKPYPAPGLRPSGDIDFYVQPGEYARAREVLGPPDDDALLVDLHSGFSDLDDRSPAEIHRRLVSLEIGGARVLGFGAEDHLRLLSLHLLRHGVRRALWLCDVAAALEARPQDFDWDYLGSGDPRRTRQTACVLGLAFELLGSSRAGVPAAWAATLPRWLGPAVLEEWGRIREPHGRREPVSASLLLRSGVIEALRARWPNAIEATTSVRGPFNELPRLPFQVGDALRRSWRFARNSMARPRGPRGSI